MRKVILTLAVAVIPLFVHAQTTRLGLSRGNDTQQTKFDQFYQYLGARYVDTVNNAKIVETAIKAVLADLDPHSAYLSPEEMQTVNESFEGSFSGIGVEFDVISDTLIVVNTIRGGPSESVGVMANDKIISIDGESSVGILRTDVPKRLRGPKGTIVEIEVLRRGMNQPLRFRITRDNIPIHTVDAAYKPDGRTGYIRVNRFAENTMSEFRDAYRKFGKIENLIVDLRGNGGGFMDQAIQMSEFFLPAGSAIVSTEGRTVPESTYTSRSNGTFLKGKVIMLIDMSSASASEIVAGAIQDWDRGVIIGQPSFGKGLVQQQVPLIDGSAVRITVSRYHTPTGRVIQRPFEKGKAEEYYIDHFRRAYDASYTDSVNIDAPRYRTLRTGREVLGGGGITPDVIIPLDTTRNYSYWNQLTRAGVINQFINSYLDRERTTLERAYPDFDSFAAGYNITPDIISGIAEMGSAQGIDYDEQTAADSMQEMRLYIKALVAQKLWDTSEYFRIINAEDEEFTRAMELIRDNRSYDSILSGSGKPRRR